MSELTGERRSQIDEALLSAVNELDVDLRGIIDFLMLEFGGVIEAPQAKDISALVEQMVAGDPSSPSGWERLELSVSAATPMEVDPLLLRAAVLPLLHNAVEFSDGPVRVEIDASGPSARINITDQGPGIAGDILENLGTPFRTHPIEGAQRVSRLGLGLACATRAAEMMGADLSLTTHDGEGAGTRATVTL